MNNKPDFGKPYDLTKESEINRWFREMEGYLKCGYNLNPPEDFKHQGTDQSGRTYAANMLPFIKEAIQKSEREQTAREIFKELDYAVYVVGLSSKDHSATHFKGHYEEIKRKYLPSSEQDSNDKGEKA